MLIDQDFTRERAKYLGGSDLGALLGLSKYRTAVDVWLEKTGKHLSYQDSLPLRFGKFAEAFVAQEYANLTGHHLVQHEDAVTHPQHNYLQGHIDRFIHQCDEPLFDAQGKCLAQGLLECKTANPFAKQEWGDAGSDQVPLPYLIQCAWYLLLTQVPHCDVAVLFGNAELRVYQIPRDPELEILLLDHAVRFWEDHVLKDIPPAAKCEADYQHVFARGSQRIIEASPEIANLIDELLRVQEHIEQQEHQVSQMKQRVMGVMEDAEILNFDGKVLATWKAPKPSVRLDAKRLTKEHPEWVLPYQVAVQSNRRLLIKTTF
jgi:putative phage-type endonuclease